MEHINIQLILNSSKQACHPKENWESLLIPEEWPSFEMSKSKISFGQKLKFEVTNFTVTFHSKAPLITLKI